jgi:predicted P-loop ATPase
MFNNREAILEEHFGSPVTQEGLDVLAELISTKSKPAEPPDQEPWHSIYQTMTLNLDQGMDHDSAWQAAITQYPTPVQFGLTTMINAAIQDYQDQQQATKNRKRIKTKQYLQQFNKFDYEFLLNTCDDSIIVEHNHKQEKMSDLFLSQIYRQLADTGAYTEKETKHCINVAALRNAFHPVRDYLQTLSWDGQPNIENLSSYFVDKDGVFYLWLRKWLIGAVARVFKYGVQNAMLVLDGPQNIGKSTFVRWLCPVISMHVESPISPGNKDDDIKLITKWIWEVTELGSTVRKADIEALKGFLTTEQVTVRVPYGHFPINKPALASFVGTINNSGGFLNDPTGSRRFNVTTVTSINWDYQKLDINQIWAEAYAAFQLGEPWTLSKDEQKTRDQINETYQIDDPVEAAIFKLFEIDPSHLDWYLPTIDIVKVIEDPMQGGIRSGSTLSTARMVSQTLTKLGCMKSRKNHGTLSVYCGIRIK